VSGVSPTGTLGYGLDEVGNRTSRTGSLGTLGAQTLSYNSNDWLTSTDKYDSNGNTVTNVSNQPYFYDYEDRLTNFNNGAVVIVYNADDQRVKKATSTKTVLYLVDTHNPSGYPQVLEELSVVGGATNLTCAYVYGLTLISQRQPSVVTNFYGQDGRGSVRGLLNLVGAVTDTYTYDAYGTLINTTGTNANNYLYCGEQFDPNLGFYYFRARNYCPPTGRFWTMDTTEGTESEPLSLHKYMYAQGDPVDNADPSGHDIESLLTGMDIYSQWAGQPRIFGVALGTCGQDVTPYVNQTLASMKKSFAQLGKGFFGSVKQLNACSGILVDVRSSFNWEVNWMLGMKSTYQKNTFWNGAKGCKDTLSYENKCFDRHALWYFLFGQAAKLCNKRFHNRYDDALQNLENGLHARQLLTTPPPHIFGPPDEDWQIENKVSVARYFYLGQPQLNNQRADCGGCASATSVPNAEDWKWKGVR